MRKKSVKSQKKTRSRFQSIKTENVNEGYVEEINSVDKIEIKDEKEESLPLVKKTHKGEDSRTYDDKVQYALEELTEELGLSDYEINAEDSNIIRSRYKDVDISIEYLS